MTIKCYDREGECFGRTIAGRCEVLNQRCVPCPFKKPERLVTNGVFYPYDTRKCKERSL